MNWAKPNSARRPTQSENKNTFRKNLLWSFMNQFYKQDELLSTQLMKSNNCYVEIINGDSSGKHCAVGDVILCVEVTDWALRFSVGSW